MDTYKLKWTQLQQRIFRLLCIKSGKSLNQREIARILKVSPTSIAKSLPILKKENLISIEKSKNMNLTLIELNRDNEKAMELKRVGNLKMIYESQIVNFLENNFPGCTIILFGSFSRGDDIFDSDIDIAIIGIKEKEIPLEKFEKILERAINLNFYRNTREIHKHLRENIFNGIVLRGGIEL